MVVTPYCTREHGGNQGCKEWFSKKNGAVELFFNPSRGIYVLYGQKGNAILSVEVG